MAKFTWQVLVVSGATVAVAHYIDPVPGRMNLHYLLGILAGLTFMLAMDGPPSF